MKVTYSDRLDNKQNNKLMEMDTDLTVVVETWPQLPSAIRSVIIDIVRILTVGGEGENWLGRHARN
jgi:hypothetical protein